MKKLTATILPALLAVICVGNTTANAGDRHSDKIRKLHRELAEAQQRRSRELSRSVYRHADDDDDDDHRRYRSSGLYSYQVPRTHVYRGPSVYRSQSVYRSPSLYRSSRYGSSGRGVSLSIGWGTGGVAIDTTRPRYVEAPIGPAPLPQVYVPQPNVYNQGPVLTPPPVPVLPAPTVQPILPVPDPHGYVHENVPQAAPVAAWGSIVHAPVPVYDRIRVKDLDETHPHSNKVMVAVRDPNACDRNPHATVYVPVCMPPHLPRGMSVEVKRGGEKMRMDFGDYSVDIESRRGVVTLDYDD